MLIDLWLKWYKERNNLLSNDALNMSDNHEIIGGKDIYHKHQFWQWTPLTIEGLIGTIVAILIAYKVNRHMPLYMIIPLLLFVYVIGRVYLFYYILRYVIL